MYAIRSYYGLLEARGRAIAIEPYRTLALQLVHLNHLVFLGVFQNADTFVFEYAGFRVAVKLIRRQ